jgi:hypothetical protein
MTKKWRRNGKMFREKCGRCLCGETRADIDVKEENIKEGFIYGNMR